LTELKRQVAGGMDVNDTSTVGEFLEHWLSVARGGLLHNSWLAYCQVVRDHIVPFVGGVRLADLRPDHVQRLYSERLAAGVGASAVRHTHKVLHRALGQAVRWGLVVRNVADLVERPTVPRAVVRALSAGEVQGLLLAARGERLEGMYYLAVVTGMRIGELLGVQWSDVDWERQGVSVSRQVSRVRGGGLVFQPVKTAAGNRLVALGEDGLDVLRGQQVRVEGWRGFAGERWVEQDLIFPNGVGKPLEHRRVGREFRVVCERAGLGAVRFHDLRHTSASLMLRARVPALVVSDRLGHSNVGITLDVYSHVIEEMQSEAAATIEAVVRPIVMELPKPG
jgi:integrase